MSFQQRLTKTATVYRPTVQSGKRDPDAAPVHLSGLSCTPLYAADVGRLGQLAQAEITLTLHKAFETFVGGAQDIIAGDLVEVDGSRYIVRAVAVWDRGGDDFTHLTVELVK